MDRTLLIAGDAYPELAREVARLADMPLVPTAIESFADGETRIAIDGDVRSASVCIIQPTSAPVNERLMTLALIADAARGEGAVSVTAVMPYFGYARQDVRGGPGEPRSAQLAARILRCAGVTRAVVLELHTAALESAFEMPVTQLQADELLLSVIRVWNLARLVVVSPDAGGFKRVQRIAEALKAPFAVVAKTRPQADVSAPSCLCGDVRGRACVIIDDMASTGGTIAGAAGALREAGAGELHAVFVHAVMAPGALERIVSAGVQRIAASDSVGPLRDPRIQVLPTAPLLARCLET